MRGGGGVMVDILVAALIVSAAAHVGLMIWAEPKVMTHVTSGIGRVTRHAPMTASREEPSEEPVKLEIVQDLPAQKEAPEVDDTAIAVPAPCLRRTPSCRFLRMPCRRRPRSRLQRYSTGCAQPLTPR